MKGLMKMMGILLTFFLVMLLQGAQPFFQEYSGNPVFSPGRAYYPTVIFDPDHFGDAYLWGLPYYKMWYSTGAGIQLAYSEDGITWNYLGALNLLASAHHAHVLYDRNGFGGTANCYKMWFWDTSVSIYTLDALKYAESPDGINWTWFSVTQDASSPLVTGIYPDWNRGTYGPADVFYNSTGSSGLDDASLWNNKYVMYYDGTTGGIEQVGLAYSVNGLHWKRYGSGPVLPVSPGAWDSNYVGFGTVVNLNGYHFFYSGGQNAMHEGIGYAFSSDGMTWTKADQPIFHITDGVSWRSVRCYTPSVVVRTSQERACLTMWFTGDDGRTRGIGMAMGCLPVTGGGEKQSAERKIQEQMTALARYNYRKCCEDNEKIINELLTTLKGTEETPEYKKALELIEQARYYCMQSETFTDSGNAVAGNYCAVRSCELYAEAIQILKGLA